jgi:FeS assembly SUF system protein
MKTLPLVPPAGAPTAPETMTTTPDPTATPGAADVSQLVPDAARTEELKPKIVAAIETIFDPEIPVNIWELGLIYDVLADAAGVAGIRMTLTAPGCPAAQSLPVEVAEKVKAIPGVTDAKVEIVWEPAWSKDRMSEAAQLQLGLW